MSLINCPECGKEISNRSEICINCGYPIKKTNICNVNGNEYDLSFLLDESYSTLYKVRDLIQISKSDIAHVKPEVEKIIQENKIPSFLSLPTKQSNPSTQVTCPYCHSTNVKKITATSKAGSVALWGIFSQKVKKNFHCNNCKSDF